jgi:hypothetical protein
MFRPDFTRLPLTHLAALPNDMASAFTPAMTSYDTPDSVDAVLCLRQEIEKLTQEQSEALKTATFVGMTAEEAKIYDARRRRITDLVEELRGLRNTK